MHTVTDPLTVDAGLPTLTPSAEFTWDAGTRPQDGAAFAAVVLEPPPTPTLEVEPEFAVVAVLAFELGVLEPEQAARTMAAQTPNVMAPRCFDRMGWRTGSASFLVGVVTQVDFRRCRGDDLASSVPEVPTERFELSLTTP